MRNWLPPVFLTICLFAAASLRAAENKATLIVPASAIVPGPESGPDDDGGFAVRVPLAAVQVKASRCPIGKPSLELQMPDTMPTGDGIDLSVAQKAVARKKADFYRSIMAPGEAGCDITFHLLGDPGHLSKMAGTIIAPYCIVSLDEGYLTP